MEMPKFINVGERIMMEVKPVSSLLKSSLISEVISSGRKFVVDMNTGSLTIYNPKIPINPELNKDRIEFILSFNNHEIHLSSDITEALKQIEELLVCNGYARLRVLRNWKIVGVAQYLGKRNVFEQTVKALYMKYGN